MDKRIQKKITEYLWDLYAQYTVFYSHNSSTFNKKSLIQLVITECIGFAKR